LSAQHHATHRSAPSKRRPLRRHAKLAAVLTGLSLGLTGLAVGGGLLLEGAPAIGSASSASTASAAIAAPASLTEAQRAQEEADRVDRTSRSADRAPVADLSRARSLSNASGPAKTRSEDLSSADPRTLTKALMPQFGMAPSDFGCIDAIWTQESGWNVHADNPTSSAYGIPQALPGSKMSSAGPDWENNPVTQIKWGLGYIKERYGSACGAAAYKRSHGTY
jgi:hypothetical protein